MNEAGEAMQLLRATRQILAEYPDDGALRVQAEAIDRFFINAPALPADSGALLTLLANSMCPDCDFAYNVTRYMPDNNCENCIHVRACLLGLPAEQDEVVKALNELRKMFPDYWVRIDQSVRYEPEMNAAAVRLVMISIDKLVDDFEGATLDGAMKQVRQWKEQQ